MSERICPVCGKPNPEEAELCQFCGSNLFEKTSDQRSEKPGTSPLNDFLAGLAQLNDEEEDVPSWLKDLQGNHPAGTPTQEPAAQVPTSEAEAQDQSPSTESGDGLKAEMGAFNFEESPEPFPLAGGETPDWLNALKAHDDESQAAKSAAEIPTETGQSQPGAAPVPDWLSSLTGVPSSKAEDDLPVEPQAAESGTPDWISSLGTTAISSEPTQEDGTAKTGNVETPDWLSALDQNASQPVESTPAERPGSSYNPSWLDDLQSSILPADESSTEPEAPAEESQAAVPATELPSWLADLQKPLPSTEELAAEPDASVEETPATFPATDLPSWLADLQKPLPSTEEPAAEPAAPVEETPATFPATELPSWLADLQNPLPTAEEPTSETGTPADEIQTTFSTGEAPTSTETPRLPAGTTPQDQYGGLPDWMAEALNAKASEQPVGENLPVVAEPTQPESELPAWMAGLGAAITPEKTIGDAAGTDPVKMKTPTPGSALSARESPAPPETGIEQDILPENISALPTEGEREEVISAPVEQENIDSILAMDAPAWLGEEPQQNAAPADESQVPAGEQPSSELSAGELPSWLQVMRPVESALEEHGEGSDEQLIEELGPLAGLSSVLPVQPGSKAGMYTQNAYPVKLVISETQQTQAALLDSLLNTENNSQASSKGRVALINQPLRWVIAAVLLAAVLVVAVLGSSVFPSPTTPTESSPIGMFLKTVRGLPDGAAVLVVMDYQPGFAGELEPAAGAVLEQLISKREHLAFLSTSPLGGLMAERLVQKFADTQTYQAGNQYVDLGYLPGGAGSIRAFAEQPRSILGRDPLLGNLWDSPVLQAVTINSQTELNNFAAMIVMTDNPDTGRLWIEQTQPSLRTTPILMVVSAQAEQMLQPYFDSNQIEGLVSGLEGGLLYENAQGKPGQSRMYWDGFGVAVLTAELVILIGGLWSVISVLRARRVAVEQDEA